MLTVRRKVGGAKLRLTTVLMLLVLGASLQAQNYSDTLSVYFRQGKSTFDRAYESNGQRADTFVASLRRIIENRSHSSVNGIHFIISCSPEGSREVNERLVRERTRSVLSWVRRKLPLDGIGTDVELEVEPWAELLSMVEADRDVPMRGEVLSELQLILQGHSGKQSLMSLGDGLPWKYMLEHHFPSLRRFEMIVSVDVCLPDVTISERDLQDFYDRTQLPLEVELDDFSGLDSSVRPVALMAYKTPKRFPVYVKTNLVAVAMLVGNAAVEVAFPDSRLSLNIPIYYSGLDWFSRTTKFRMAGVLPELRYNFNSPDGLYAGIHAGLAWYNFAFSGDWRIQDAGGNSPAVGGGLSVGYKMTPFRSVPELGVEFNAGVGVYSLKYDKFYNEPNGPVAESGISAVRVVPDALGVSVFWRFGDRGRSGR